MDPSPRISPVRQRSVAASSSPTDNVVGWIPASVSWAAQATIVNTGAASTHRDRFLKEGFMEVLLPVEVVLCARWTAAGQMGIGSGQRQSPQEWSRPSTGTHPES